MKRNNRRAVLFAAVLSCLVGFCVAKGSTMEWQQGEEADSSRTKWQWVRELNSEASESRARNGNGAECQRLGEINSNVAEQQDGEADSSRTKRQMARTLDGVASEDTWGNSWIAETDEETLVDLWDSLPVVTDGLELGEESAQNSNLGLELPSVPEGTFPQETGSGQFFAKSDEEQLPERWYAGDYGRKPTVRHQGNYGTCWALAATSALEAALLPERHLVFSADHMSRKNAFTVDLNEGGDYLMTMAYLSGWQGPVTEAEDPYGDEYSPDGLSPAVHVQEIQVLENAELKEIKKAVRSCGAVQTSLYMDRVVSGGLSSPVNLRYYNEPAKAYFCPQEQTPNHDVIILGWDDHFSRFRFTDTPERDGAFICQNTWEEGFGEDGIFYVSYADPNIAQTAVFYTRVEPTDNYAHLYQYDECGWQGRQGYGDETCWFANVYTAVDDAPLAAVGFYAVSPNTFYDIYMVDEFQGEKSFADRSYLQSGTLKNVGYYTIDLEEQQRLEAGERFAVIVRITSPGNENPVAVEYRADQYTQNVTTEGKEGYLSQYGEYWENTEECFGTNVCLKAYT